MKKMEKVICSSLAVFAALGCVACRSNDATGEIKLTVWVSESDKPFVNSVVEEFKSKHPDKNYMGADARCLGQGLLAQRLGKAGALLGAARVGV